MNDRKHELDHEAEARRMFTLIGNPVVEIRAIPLATDKHRSLATGLFQDVEDFAETAVGMSSLTGPDERYAGVYMTINRLNAELKAAASGYMDKGWGVRDAQIERIRTLFVDLDPKREHPSGGRVCASDAEHDAAMALARHIADQQRALGWPEPLMMDSGNGAYVIYRLDLPNNPESVRLVKQVLETFAAKFDTAAVHIDQSVHNPARVVRIAGTWNRKSEPTDDRPNRPARIVSAPARLEVVTIEQLNSFAACDILPPEANGEASCSFFDEVYDCEAQVEAVLKYLERVHLEPSQVDRGHNDFIRVNLPYCPFKGPAHVDGRTAILIWRSGSIGVKCFHEKCDGHGWAELQKKLGLPFDQVADETATSLITGQTSRRHDDPLVLARRHLHKWAAEDGSYTLVHFLGDTYRFDHADGWQLVRPGELDPWVRRTIQDAFDEHAKMVSNMTGEMVKPKPVTHAIVSNTVKAMESIVTRPVSVTWQSPFWLEPFEDWDANDVLCFRNGILNVRRFIEGQQTYFIPPTVKLFYEYQAAFDFPTEVPPAPNEWNRFLDSLGQDDNWRKCLQEIMGYCLWPNYDLQKLFMVVGPPRSGKGTISRVIESLVGGPLAVCAPDLKNFADEFGLEQAISKRLAMVPEVQTPDKGVHNVVTRLKAITGGDSVTINRKHLRAISVRLRTKIIMYSNLFTPLPDNSGALHARLIPLKLTKSFIGKEDTELADKLRQEYPAILLWAMDGLRRLWQAGGKFTLPKSTRDLQEQLLAASAPLQEFLEECCDLDSRVGVETVALHRIYQNWFADAHPGEHPLTEKEFAHELTAAAPAITKKRATTPHSRTREGCKIVETEFDVEIARPYFWLGICPKPGYRKVTANDPLRPEPTILAVELAQSPIQPPVEQA